MLQSITHLDSKAPLNLLSIAHEKSTTGLGRNKSLQYNVGDHWIVAAYTSPGLMSKLANLKFKTTRQSTHQLKCK